ncbi:hypothetical protein GX441_10765 [bacterium]|nr:hypothetical protein [bacterium]
MEIQFGHISTMVVVLVMWTVVAFIKLKMEVTLFLVPLLHSEEFGHLRRMTKAIPYGHEFFKVRINITV